MYNSYPSFGIGVGYETFETISMREKRKRMKEKGKDEETMGRVTKKI